MACCVSYSFAWWFEPRQADFRTIGYIIINDKELKGPRSSLMDREV